MAAHATHAEALIRRAAQRSRTGVNRALYSVAIDAGTTGSRDRWIVSERQ
jgi:hypothetical protein